MSFSSPDPFKLEDIPIDEDAATNGEVALELDSEKGWDGKSEESASGNLRESDPGTLLDQSRPGAGLKLKGIKLRKNE